MAKIFLFMMVSVDGYFEGPDHDLSWHNVDAEFNEFAIEQTKNVGTLLFGKRTYDLMSSYWPTDSARKDDPIVAELMNKTPKIVFSSSMKELTPISHWENVRLINKIDPSEIERLKAGSGKDIGVYGSNQLCVSLMEMGLVDEFRLMVNPVAIGKGTPLLYGIKNKVNLKLLDLKQFKSGNVLLNYQPK